MTIETRKADLFNPEDANAIVSLLDHYACDPMGGGEPLPEATRQTLVSALQKRPEARILLAFEEGRPVGLLNGFEGFSTFKAKPLFYVHDLVTHENVRGKGVGRALLQAAEAWALQTNCCKLTLEVLSGNHPAKTLYEKEGYMPYQLDPQTGLAEFWEKPLQRKK